MIVHPEIDVLNNTANDLEKKYKFPDLNVGKQLSKALLPIKLGERKSFTRQWFNSKLLEFSPGPILTINIDLLFEPSLQLDPLQLFRMLGRRIKLVVMWPGEFDGTSLSYAVPEHRNYQVWQNPDIQINRIH